LVLEDRWVLEVIETCEDVKKKFHKKGTYELLF